METANGGVRNEICRLVQTTKPTHRGSNPRFRRIGAKIGITIIRIPTQSINIPSNRMIRSIIMNMPHLSNPKARSILVMTFPHPALKKAPVNSEDPMAIKMIIAVILSVI